MLRNRRTSAQSRSPWSWLGIAIPATTGIMAIGRMIEQFDIITKSMRKRRGEYTSAFGVGQTADLRGPLPATTEFNSSRFVSASSRSDADVG